MDKANLPIIDIGALRHGDKEGSQQAAQLIDRACRDVGFFLVVNHGIPFDSIKATFEHARAFFDLPLKEKLTLSLEKHSNCFRGYAPVLSELADGKPNSYELMEFSVEFEHDHPDVLARKPMHGPNLWPELPGYRAALTRYIEHMIHLGFDLMRGIAMGLGLEDDFFRRAFNGRPFWQFRTAHYPDPASLRAMSSAFPHVGQVPQVEVGDQSCGAHTDYGCLTMLLADSPGLQILTTDGEWVSVPVVPGAYVCNVGDMLQYWTRDTYVATRHRVMTEGERISLPFFFQPDYETIVEPPDLFPVLSSKPFPALRYGPYAFEKYRGIYPGAVFSR
ncbi:conserved hypothetical protein [Paraburkholderia ribeironis]|uniref:2-oxoglutarate-dependent ethylene/succinate-forming enzyme n=1 Tax=Paraburkholderia ribeironis TaxID=1247936 RepID=A0A1N7S8S2_9BURK|nr:2-oxoglutarate and iron-dependent oxygenase domain-containing protein [Paraburkholderia ribeironis]SIT43775.1 conserved hypothetical protein [Paraburkholderia ribeironis]